MSIVSRSDAIQAGKKYYFTGASCCHGHLAARFVSTRRCAECHRTRKRGVRSRKNPSEKTCAICSAHFSTSIHSKMTCSDMCKSFLKRIRNRRHQARAKAEGRRHNLDPIKRKAREKRHRDRWRAKEKQADYKAAWRPKNRARINEYARKYYAELRAAKLALNQLLGEQNAC